MHWLNIHTSTLDSAEFLCATPLEQATWLKLLRYCAGQENSGVIRGSSRWPDRHWQQLVRVKLRDVRRECGLWERDGDDLKVKFYPADKELEVQAKRRAGLSTYAKRHAQRTAEQGAQPPEKGRELKGTERKEKEGGSLSLDSSDSESNIPSVAECLQWGQSAGVPEDWIRGKHESTTCNHSWIRNSRVIKWQRRWKDWFEEDRATGRWPKNSAARPVGISNGDVPKPPGESAVDLSAMRSQP